MVKYMYIRIIVSRVLICLKLYCHDFLVSSDVGYIGMLAEG